MRCAFTLVEMLATAAMTALLFITALSVSSGLLRQQRAADALGKATTPPALVELLRWDLINSREMKNYRRGIELEGFGALDQRTLAPTCLGPTRVVYDVEKIDQQSWLMRRQFRAGVWSTELVCPHVLNMTVEQIAVQRKIAGLAAFDPAERSKSGKVGHQLGRIRSRQV